MKRFIALFVALMLCLSISAGAFAAAAPEDNAPVVTGSSEEPTRAEETQWYTRTTPDGLIQMRLWSITYGYWKTDWITIGHV